MKKIFTLIVSLLVIHQVGFCQKDSTAKKPEEKVRQFWLVILKTEIFTGHFANMERLYNDGILKAAGPFGKNDFTWRGLFILDCKTKDDAETYVKTDPAVAAGVFIVDIVPWYSQPTGSFVPGSPKKGN